MADTLKQAVNAQTSTITVNFTRLNVSVKNWSASNQNIDVTQGVAGVSVAPNVIAPFGIARSFQFSSSPNLNKIRVSKLATPNVVADFKFGGIKQEYLTATHQPVNFVHTPTAVPLSSELFVGLGDQSAYGNSHRIYRLKDIIDVQGIGVANFLADYATSIINKNQGIKPLGFSATGYGLPTAYNLTQYISPNGTIGTLFGLTNVSPRFIYVNSIAPPTISKPLVYSLNQYIQVTGYKQEMFGSPSLTNTRQFIKPSGFNAEQVNNPTVWFYNRELTQSGKTQTEFGKPFVMGGVKYIEPIGISLGVNYQVTYSADEVRAGIAYDEHSIPVDDKRTYKITILSVGLVGNQAIVNKNLTINASGFDSLAFGKAELSHDIRTINPQGIDSLAMGYVDQPSYYSPPYVWTSPDYSMRAYWDNFSSYQWVRGITVWYGKRPVWVQGFDASQVRLDNGQYQSTVSTPTVGHRVRTIYLQGFDSSQISKKPILNHKQFISPYGIYGTLFGALTELINTKLFVIKPSGINGGVVANPSASPRFIIANGFNASVVSTPSVTGGLFQGFDSLEVGYHVIGHFIQKIRVIGFDSLKFGDNDIRPLLNEIKPISVIREAGVFGDVTIANRTREVKPQGVDSPPISQWTSIYLNTQQIRPAGIGENPLALPSIYNLTQIVGAVGFGSQAFVKPVIADYVRKVYPLGSRMDVYGQAMVWKTPKAQTIGNDMAEFGFAQIHNLKRYIKTGNIYAPDNQVSKGATIDYREKYVTLVGIKSDKFGETLVGDFLRYVETKGNEFSSYGMAWVSQHTRQLAPPSIKPIDLSPQMVSRPLTISTQGFEATEWLTRIIPEITTVYHQSRDSAIFGETVILSMRQIGSPKGFGIVYDERERYGMVKVFNSRQYIHHQQPDVDNHKVTAFGQWTAIANKNRMLSTVGNVFTKFGYAQIDNKAEAIIVSGIDSQQIPQPMIAYRVRHLSLDGIEPLFMGQWHIIYNGARVVFPQGFDSQALPMANIKKTRRYYERVGNWDSQAFGTPMIADRIRWAVVESRYGIVPPYIQLPTIENLTRYIEPQGIDLFKNGVPDVVERFNKAMPRWVHKDYIGEPSIRNVTPEIRTGGTENSLFGNTLIRNQWETLYAKGDECSAFGRHLIRDRRINVWVKGIDCPSISQKHLVTKTVSPPYALQYIKVDEFDEKANGSRFGMAGLNQNVLYSNGIFSKKFGEPFVQSNAIIIKYGISDSEVSSNLAVTNQVRFIEVASVSKGETFGLPKVREQNIRPYHYADDGLSGEIFGFAKIENQHRKLYPIGIIPPTFKSVDGVTLTTAYILPKGIRPPYMGLPIIPFVPQKFEVQGFSNEEVGYPIVSQPKYLGTQTISQHGMNGLSFGNTRIETLHRQVYPQGFNANRMGISDGNDTPYMWQHLRIGERVPFVLDSFETLIVGNTTISLKVRQVMVDGFDALVFDYEAREFDKRMKVSYAHEINRNQIIAPVSIKKEDVGLSTIKNTAHYILPDGNSETYRQGIGTW